MKDRDMYYGQYGYRGFYPMPNMSNQMNGIPQNQTPPIINNYSNSQFNDLNERVSRLERQIKRLDQRLTRLETPYANSNKLNNEPDDSMYIM